MEGENGIVFPKYIERCIQFLADDLDCIGRKFWPREVADAGKVASCKVRIPTGTPDCDDPIQKLETFIEAAKLKAELDGGTSFVAVQPRELLVELILMLQELRSKLTDAAFPLLLLQMMIPRIRPHFFDEAMMNVRGRKLFDPLVNELGTLLFLRFRVRAVLGVV